jgi:hypothetical protein
MPEKLKTVLKEAPLAWGIVALLDYRQGKKTVNQIIREWKDFKLQSSRITGALPNGDA